MSIYAFVCSSRARERERYVIVRNQSLEREREIDQEKWCLKHQTNKKRRAREREKTKQINERSMMLMPTVHRVHPCFSSLAAFVNRPDLSLGWLSGQLVQLLEPHLHYDQPERWYSLRPIGLHRNWVVHEPGARGRCHLSIEETKNLHHCRLQGFLVFHLMLSPIAFARRSPRLVHRSEWPGVCRDRIGCGRVRSLLANWDRERHDATRCYYSMFDRRWARWRDIVILRRCRSSMFRRHPNVEATKRTSPWSLRLEEKDKNSDAGAVTSECSHTFAR